MNGAPKTGMLLGLIFEPMNPPHRPSTSLVGKLAGRECRIGSTLTAPTRRTSATEMARALIYFRACVPLNLVDQGA